MLAKITAKQSLETDISDFKIECVKTFLMNFC